MTLPEFLAWEERQSGRHEFHHGEIVAMVGGTVAHNQIIGNIDRELARLLRGAPCRVFRESLKTVADDSVFYPDVLVTCAKLNDQDRLAAEPSVIVEVLSDSTAARDHPTKSTAYRTLTSLTQHVIVHQRAAAVESLRRDGESWLHEVISGEAGILHSPALGVELPLAVVYEDTEVPFVLDDESGNEDER